MVRQSPVPPVAQTKAAREGFLPHCPADCRLRGSSFSIAAFLWPAGSQRGGNERQEQLVVAGNGVAVRCGSAAAAGGGRGPLHYILHGTVVLDKVEIRSSNGAQRDANVADHGNRFQKNLRQKNGGAPIEIDATWMHLLHQRAEQTEIVVRGIAEGRTISGGMHVRNVCADGEMDGHRNAVFVRGYEDAEIAVFDFDDPTRKVL